MTGLLGERCAPVGSVETTLHVMCGILPVGSEQRSNEAARPARRGPLQPDRSVLLLWEPASRRRVGGGEKLDCAISDALGSVLNGSVRYIS
jgi:hypothetical protein